MVVVSISGDMGRALTSFSNGMRKYIILVGSVVDLVACCDKTVPNQSHLSIIIQSHLPNYSVNKN